MVLRTLTVWLLLALMIPSGSRSSAIAGEEVAKFQGTGDLESPVFQLDGDNEIRVEVAFQAPTPFLFGPGYCTGFLRRIDEAGDETPADMIQLVVPIGQRANRGSMVLERISGGSQKYMLDVVSHPGAYVFRFIDTGKPAGTSRAKFFQRSRLVGKWERDVPPNEFGDLTKFAREVFEINNDGTAVATLFREKTDETGSEIKYLLSPISQTSARLIWIDAETSFSGGAIGLDRLNLVVERPDPTDKSFPPRSTKVVFSRVRER